MRHHPAVARTRSAVTACLADVDPGDLVLAAVSGGADSVALAAALAHAGRSGAVRTGALVVDHRLQPDSAHVAATAQATCRDLGLDPVCVETVRVGTRGGPEAAAREARYAALDAAAGRLGAVTVLLGHTLDDQAETVLLRLARGSGARSLAGMAERSGRYRRPFLAVRRDDTRAACAALGLAFWDDPHNGDPGFARARVRDRVMPALEEALGPGTAEALARTAALLRDDADALDEWTRSAEWTGSTGDDLAVASLARLPRAVRTRVLRRAAVAAGAPAGALSARHVHELDRLVTEWHGQGPVALPGGLVAARACDRLTFR